MILNTSSRRWSAAQCWHAVQMIVKTRTECTVQYKGVWGTTLVKSCKIMYHKASYKGGECHQATHNPSHSLTPDGLTTSSHQCRRTSGCWYTDVRRSLAWNTMWTRLARRSSSTAPVAPASLTPASETTAGTTCWPPTSPSGPSSNVTRPPLMMGQTTRLVDFVFESTVCIIIRLCCLYTKPLPDGLLKKVILYWNWRTADTSKLCKDKDYCTSIFVLEESEVFQFASKGGHHWK